MNQCGDLVTIKVQQFFERLLNKLNIHNFAIKIIPGCNKGENYSGIIANALVEGEDEQGKKILKSFIIKSASRDEGFRKLFLSVSTFNREIYVYTRVLHEFNVLQKQRNVKKYFVSYPKYYDSSMENLNEAIILEDMKKQGFQLWSRQKLLNFDHCVVILREYAKLHALSFAARLHNPNQFNEFAKNTQDAFHSAIQREHPQNGYWRQGKNVLLIIDPLKEKSLYEKFKKFHKNMNDVIQNLLGIDLTDAHGVITHGDGWITNFLFKYDVKPATPVDVCILDWQLSHFGSPALDIAQLLFTCTEKELRDKYYTTFIEEYYDAFSIFLAEMGGNAQDQFSFVTLQEHLKKYSVYGLYTAILCLLTLNSDGSEIPDKNDISKPGDFIERFKNNSKNEDVYNRRMKGDNFSGVIAKAKVEGDNEHGCKVVRSFIIKSAPRSESLRKFALVVSSFNREIFMYEKVLYEFDLLQKEINVKKPFKSYPRYYDSSMESLNEFVILEDMNEQGFELHCRRRLLNLDHSLLVLREYAKLHALSFAMRLHKPTVFKEFSENAEEMFFSVKQKTNPRNSFWKQGQNVLLSINQFKEKSLYEKFKKFHCNMSEIIQNLLKSDLTNPYGVIRYADSWINNFLFKYDRMEEPRTPCDVCILDWQLSHYGSPALDLAYFFFSCTDKELRDNHYSFLIKEYYSTFSSFLVEMGGDPTEQFPFEVLKQHLKKFSVFGLYTALLCLMSVSSSDEMSVSEINDMSKIGDFVEQFNNNTKAVEEYNRRIKGIMIDMERLGYDFY
ncbi:hypothetical protein FQR65_LT02286 [Abscondita terminalis]|nr:hypothetical protein FQR65_LT02286 [Abscondita terminalis]